MIGRSPIGPTLPMPATAVNANYALAALASQGKGTWARLTNIGPNKAYIKFGNGAQTATTNDMPVPVGAVEDIYLPPSVDNAAVICAATETAGVAMTALAMSNI